MLLLLPQKRENSTGEFTSELKFHCLNVEGLLNLYEAHIRIHRVSRAPAKLYDFLFGRTRVHSDLKDFEMLSI